MFCQQLLMSYQLDVSTGSSPDGRVSSLGEHAQELSGLGKHVAYLRRWITAAVVVASTVMPAAIVVI